MRRKLSIIFLAVLLGNAFFVIATAFGGEIDQGKALYTSKCMICHGANGKGDGPAAGALNPHPKNFERPQFWQSDVDRKIADTIRKGRPPMPAFDLSDPEIKAIIAYMTHSFKK